MVELSRSLHTSSYRVACSRCLRATAWFQAVVEKLFFMTSPSRADLEQAAIQFFGTLADDLHQPRDFDLERIDQEVAFNVEHSRDRVQALDDQLISNVFDASVRHRAAELVRQTGSDFEELSEDLKLFVVQLIARAEREQMEMLIHLLERPAVEYTPGDRLFSQPSVSVLPINRAQTIRARAPAGSGPTLGRAIQLYLAGKEDRGIGNSQIDEISRALRWLRERVGDNFLIADITKATMRSFRDDLQRLDVTLRGKSVSFEARLTSNAANQIGSMTALRYWKSVQAFFAWTVSEGHAEDDPAGGLKLERRMGEVRRSPEAFTPAELQRLFQTPLFAGHLSANRLSTPGPNRHRGGQWWSGLLLLFTGLRAGECSQLLPADFVFDADIPYLKVRQEDETGSAVKSVKNTASVRDVPLSPVLLNLGLRQFVEGRAKHHPKRRVFFEFRLGSRGRTSDGMTKFWGDYLRKVGLWKPGRATHVWRHTVVACLRANGVAEEDIAAFVGHTGQSVTSTYGGAYPLSRKAQTMKKLYYGFDVAASVEVNLP
jgi:integrase